MKNLNKFFVCATSEMVKLLCASKHKRFMESLKNPAERQDGLLCQLLLDLSKTEYGRSLGISGLETYKKFSSKVNIVDYDELEFLVEKQIRTGLSILTPHRIVHIEPTSGSSGASKQIVYTKQLLNSFSNMFCIWAYDLLSHGLKLKTGKIFLSVSPKVQTASFASDTSYLDGAMGSLIAPFIVKPEGVLSSENYLQKLAETILLEEKLEVISIWSPSYLLSILQYIEKYRHEFSTLLSPERAQIIVSNDVDWRKLFPSLQLISCWDSAHSADSASQLAKLFPGAQVQGKGLLATEAPITVPISGTTYGVPLVDDVFLEFEDENAVVTLLHESIPGKIYQLIISQRAGLMRYRLSDLVMICEPFINTPTIKFIGKANIICDLVGEKLHESFVRSTISAGNKTDKSAEYLLLPFAATSSSVPAKYILLTTKREDFDAIEIDSALSKGFHYQQARRLGQLGTLEVVEVINLRAKLQKFFQNEGMKLGDIKDLALMADIEKATRLLQYLNLNSTTANMNERHHDHSKV